jgi:hypothetical protein
MWLVVTNPNLEGIRLGAIPGRLESRVTISRVRHGDETHVATDATVIHRDDRLAVVGMSAGLDQFERVIGRNSDEDLVLADSALTVAQCDRWVTSYPESAAAAVPCDPTARSSRYWRRIRVAKLQAVFGRVETHSRKILRRQVTA